MATIGSKSTSVIAQCIRRERKEQKISQSELAHLAGVSLNFVSQLESGKPSVHLDKLLSVLTVLGLELTIAYGKGGVRDAL